MTAWSVGIVAAVLIVWFGAGFLGASMALARDTRELLAQPLLNYRLATRHGGFFLNVRRGVVTLMEELSYGAYCGFNGLLIPGRRAGLEALGRQHTMCRIFKIRGSSLRQLLPL